MLRLPLIQGEGALQIDNNSNIFTIVDDPDLVVELIVSTVVQGLNGSSGLDKEGAGTLALSGDNTFGGDLNVASGTVLVESDTALGNTDGTTTVENGAAVEFLAAGLSLAEAFWIAGSGMGSQGALWVDSGDATLSGNVTMNDDSQIGAAQGSTLTLDGVLDDGGDAYDLTVGNVGTGRTVLAGDNTWEGDTAVTAGYLRAASDNALGDAGSTNTVTIADGATLELSGGISTPSTKSVILQGAGADSGADDKIINVDGDNTFGGDFLFEADASVSVAWGTTLTLSGDISQTGSSRNLTKDGDGALVLTGTGSYTGDTNINDGTMQVDGDISASDVVYVNPGATLDGTGAHGARCLRSGATAGLPGRRRPGHPQHRGPRDVARLDRRVRHRRPDRRLRLQPVRRLGHRQHRHR